MPEGEPVVVVDETPSEFDLVLEAVLGEAAETVLAEEPAEAESAPKRRRSRGGVRRRKPAAGEEGLITEETPQPDIFAPVAEVEEPAVAVAEAAVLLAET